MGAMVRNAGLGLELPYPVPAVSWGFAIGQTPDGLKSVLITSPYDPPQVYDSGTTWGILGGVAFLLWMLRKK